MAYYSLHSMVLPCPYKYKSIQIHTSKKNKRQRGLQH